jgi:chemotaxis protein CheY-P-specific phosphatase CheC
MEDWMRQRTSEEIRQDMIEGAKAFGASEKHAERFVAHLTGEKPMTDREMVRMILDAQHEAG